MSGAGTDRRIKRSFSTTGHLIGCEVSNVEYFQDRVVAIPEAGCWIWVGHVNENGYGRIRRGGKNVFKEYAHRFSYRTYKGEIPDGMCVCHKCDTPSCVNPDHLFLGTLLDNNSDMIAKKRNSVGETHKSAKLSEAAVISIRLSTESGAEMARKFGISRCYANAVRRGAGWQHLESRL